MNIAVALYRNPSLPQIRLGQHRIIVVPATRLNGDELAAKLADLPDWEVQQGKLHREYKFPDFAHAFGFLSMSAVLIEKMNHHPEWFNVYGRVVVDLTTHSAGGITARDFELAAILDSVAAKFR